MPPKLVEFRKYVAGKTLQLAMGNYSIATRKFFNTRIRTLEPSMNRPLRACVIAGAIVCGGPAMAADLAPVAPVYKALPPVASASGFYGWADGSWQGINLPSFGLGMRLINNANGNDLGAVDSFHKRLDGYGTSGGIGYLFPNGTFAPIFGSRVRVEIGANYVKANGTQSAGTVDATTPLALALLDGISDKRRSLRLRFGQSNLHDKLDAQH
jgi:hypothetical protein